jgi:cation:H+ antiporter
MTLDIIFLIGGGIAVWFGAEGMVRGAVNLAKYFGVPSLIVGLTVVAFGTSAPELVVSSIASVQGHNQIALGNVIGSNIINVGLVLGLSILIKPFTVSTDVLRRDIPVVVFVTLAVILMAWIGGQIGLVDGIILLCGLVAHTYMTYKLAVREQSRTTGAPGWERPDFSGRDVAFLVGGTVILSIGAQGMVQGAVGVASAMGIPQRIIAMTIVAFGTSVPELAASVVAAKHGESDLALGNIIGSNLYNMLLILGTAAVIAPIPSHLGISSYDFLFFLLLVVVLLPMVRLGWRLSRVDGLILLGIYAAANICFFI